MTKNNILSLTINNQRFSGWTAIRVSRSCEQYPSSFEISVTEKDWTGNKTVFVPFSPCQIYLDDDLVITGYIDQVSNSLESDGHTITLSGRSKGADMVDCSAEFPADPHGVPRMREGPTTVLALANSLGAAYGITASLQSKRTLDAIPLYQVNIGDTPYSIIELLARSQNLLVYDGTDGNMILSDLGFSEHASGFTYGRNVQGISLNLRFDQRYSEIDVFDQAVNDMQKNSLDFSYGKSFDDPYIRHRRLMAFSEAQFVPQTKWGQMRADWEMSRRQGRSQVITLRTDDWRDKDDVLWTPNNQVTVDAPALRINRAGWTIADVVYSYDQQAGTVADLVIMPPGAFALEPTVVNPVDIAIAPTMQPYDGPEIDDDKIQT